MSINQVVVEIIQGSVVTQTVLEADWTRYHRGWLTRPAVTEDSTMSERHVQVNEESRSSRRYAHVRSALTRWHVFWLFLVNISTLCQSVSLVGSEADTEKDKRWIKDFYVYFRLHKSSLHSEPMLTKWGLLLVLRCTEIWLANSPTIPYILPCAGYVGLYSGHISLPNYSQEHTVYQHTYRQRDRRCNLNTALCTIVHHAVKKISTKTLAG